MTTDMKFSHLAFRCRGLFWGVFAVGVLLFPADYDAPRFICGFLILAAGQALRFWAAGYIPKYRTEVIGAPILVTWGPFRWIRNPLYAGNFIMGAGWSLMVGWAWVAAFTAAFLLLYCLIVIPAEEEFLESKFGGSYRSYKSKVPALFPFPRGGFPDRSPDERPFNGKTAWTEEVYSLRVNLIVTLLIAARLYFTVGA